jgi:hypothetical protein
MSRAVVCLSALALIAAGCDDDQFQIRSNHQTSAQTPKPIVAVVPVIDNTNNTYDWSLSDEFSSGIYYRLSQQDHVFLVDAPHVRAKTKKLVEGQNPFGPEFSWVKKAFHGDEFVVFLELVEHQEVLKQDRKKPSAQENCAADLNMSMRVRVFDLRDAEPKIVLQELVHDTHFIPRPFTRVNFHQVPWGDASYSISPMGLAHAEFTKEIASRLDDYILMAAKE